MSDYENAQSALDLILQYGGIDGDHHKQWVLDQVVRLLTGCEYHPVAATDATGAEYEYEVLGESVDYRNWLRHHNEGEDGPETYSWDEGIAP